jgi:hypothetical protein
MQDFKTALAETLFGTPKADKPYCAFACAEPNVQFTDALSRKEYQISGLCQNCQDKMFGGSDA